MTPTQEQLLALSAVFQAASLVDKLARTGQISDAQLGCLLGSLLVRDPKNTLEVYGGDDLNLREGYKALVGALERNPASLQREPLRYALALLGLERQLAKRDDMLQVIGNRLDQIQNQVEHFGLTHDNVVAACGALYQDTHQHLPPAYPGAWRHALPAAAGGRGQGARPAAHRHPLRAPVAPARRAPLAAGVQPRQAAQGTLSAAAGLR